ncbi:MAG TPA: DUF6580 family putative transport protein [Clostridia bacterium]|nr:DUF6580 family putative transport protein [Clostridia bacterium]
MLAYLFVVAAIALRFLPHPLSFTPVAASLLFFGARMPRKHAWIPLAMLAASDVILTKVMYGYPLTADHVLTWAWYAAILGLGSLLANNGSALRIAGASLTASISFFVVSNFAVWMVWDMYPKTLSGLMTSYVAAVPYFRNTLASDLLFTAVVFSIGIAVEAFSGKTANRSATA